ncbi:MAG TPA: DNA mismatch repair protein MutS, partial [Marinobacter adhaerens]|nr:DNA mismatch repair protein MutS [Marinobacter adhaerens]
QDVIRNAKTQLSHLEGSASPAAPAASAAEQGNNASLAKPATKVNESVYQGDMFASLEPSAVEEALKDMDLDGLTPRDAMNQLYELKALMKK